MIFFAINLSNVLRRPQENPKLLSVYFLEQILFYYSSIAFEFKSKEKISAFFREIIQLYQEYIPLQQYIDFAFVDEYYERMSFAVINKFYWRFDKFSGWLEVSASCPVFRNETKQLFESFVCF